MSLIISPTQRLHQNPTEYDVIQLSQYIVLHGNFCSNLRKRCV
jgi:hypothetical protein